MHIKRMALIALLLAHPFLHAEQPSENEQKIRLSRLILRSVGTLFVLVGNTLIAASHMPLELVESEKNRLTDSLVQRLENQLDKDRWNKMGFASTANNKRNAFDPQYYKEIKTGSESGIEGKSGYQKETFILNKTDGYLQLSYESCEQNTKSVEKIFAQLSKNMIHTTHTSDTRVMGSLKDEFTQCDFEIVADTNGITTSKRRCYLRMLMEQFQKKIDKKNDEKRVISIA